MNPGQPLSACRVAILGLGLMGGSLALGLRGRCKALLGVDPDPRTLDLALQRRVVDLASSNPAEVLPQADLVVLAAPVRAILASIQKLPSLLSGSSEKQGITVLDLGSTKTEICQAYEKLPSNFDPIGGHPMCGKEQSGLEHADAKLYQGATFALVPLERTTSNARSLAAQLVEAVEARPLWVDPGTHDRWTASTSHMPYLLSIALALATPVEAAPLVGPGFRSTSRLASSSTAMMADILNTNRENVLSALDRYRLQLDKLEEHLRDNSDTGIIEILELGAAAIKKLNRNPSGGGAV